MTVKAFIVGLILAVGMACYGGTCGIWSQFSGIGGDLVPNYVFGLLLLGLLGVNPLLALIRAPTFRSSEWVLILAMGLMGAVIAGSGLLWTFPQPIIAPIRDQALSPGWRAKDVLQYVPNALLVDARGTPEDPIPDPVKDYLQGRGEAINPSEVPWSAWRATLAFWFALLGLSFVAGLCAVVVVHRQWSQREHLTYPIAIFANELVRREPGHLLGPVLGRRIFWVGFAVSFVVLVANGLHGWFPDFPAITTGIDLGPLRDLAIIKPLTKVPTYDKSVLDIRFYFAAVGLAYFLSGEVSFSLGVSGWLYVICAAPLVARGVDMSSFTFRGGLPLYMYFGAYLGMGVMVVYLGRRFYWAVLRRAVFLRRGDGDVLPTEAWAARVGIVACVGMVVLLSRIGLHPVLAVGFVVLIGLIFLMVGRVNAATGLFIIQQLWHPVDVLVGIFGAAALGPQALVVLAILCAVVTIDTRICLVPLALNMLRVGDFQKVQPGRLARWMGVAVIVAMVVGVGAAVWAQYSFGATTMNSSTISWGMMVAKMPFTMLATHIDKLTEAQLEAARQPVTLGRLLGAKPAKHFFLAAGIGLSLVVACSYLRLRFPRWPLHPVMFLVWGTPWMIVYAPCFLLAWLIKGLVLKYGGQSVYLRSRSFFIGLVVGEISAGLLWAVVAVVYYLATGFDAANVRVRP